MCLDQGFYLSCCCIRCSSVCLLECDFNVVFSGFSRNSFWYVWCMGCILLLVLYHLFLSLSSTFRGFSFFFSKTLFWSPAQKLLIYWNARTIVSFLSWTREQTSSSKDLRSKLNHLSPKRCINYANICWKRRGCLILMELKLYTQAVKCNFQKKSKKSNKNFGKKS